MNACPFLKWNLILQLKSSLLSSCLEDKVGRCSLKQEKDIDLAKVIYHTLANTTLSGHGNNVSQGQAVDSICPWTAISTCIPVIAPTRKSFDVTQVVNETHNDRQYSPHPFVFTGSEYKPLFHTTLKLKKLWSKAWKRFFRGSLGRRTINSASFHTINCQGSRVKSAASGTICRRSGPTTKAHFTRRWKKKFSRLEWDFSEGAWDVV
jgi:hypothetical protein